MFCILSTFHLSTEKGKRLTVVLLIGLTALIFLAAGVSYISLQASAGKILLGSVTNAILVGFYVRCLTQVSLLKSFCYIKASPLITFAQIIREKSSSSLNLALSATSLINSLLWTMYGIVITDCEYQVFHFHCPTYLF